MSSTKPEIDWKERRAIVVAAIPTARFCPSYLDRGMVISGEPGYYKYHGNDWAQNEAAAWITASHCPLVVEWEATHKPKLPAVDVEGELYLALRDIVTDSNIESEAYDTGVAALKLYEQKGKL